MVEKLHLFRKWHQDYSNNHDEGIFSGAVVPEEPLMVPPAPDTEIHVSQTESQKQYLARLDRELEESVRDVMRNMRDSSPVEYLKECMIQNRGGQDPDRVLYIFNSIMNEDCYGAPLTGQINCGACNQDMTVGEFIGHDTRGLYRNRCDGLDGGDFR